MRTNAKMSTSVSWTLIIAGEGPFAEIPGDLSSADVQETVDYSGFLLT